jgi:hypothetical protein
MLLTSTSFSPISSLLLCEVASSLRAFSAMALASVTSSSRRSCGRALPRLRSYRYLAFCDFDFCQRQEDGRAWRGRLRLRRSLLRSHRAAVPYRWSIPGLSRLPPSAGSTLLRAVTISSAWDNAPRSASSFFADRVRPALDCSDRRHHRLDRDHFGFLVGGDLHHAHLEQVERPDLVVGVLVARVCRLRASRRRRL